MKTIIAMLFVLFLTACASTPIPVQRVSNPEAVENPCAQYEGSGVRMFPFWYTSPDGTITIQCATSYGKLPDMARQRSSSTR